MLLDHDWYLPSYAVITEGKKHEVRVARQMRFAPGTILVFDRGYADYEWFVDLIRQGVYFMTRLKENDGVVARQNVSRVNQSGNSQRGSSFFSRREPN